MTQAAFQANAFQNNAFQCVGQDVAGVNLNQLDGGVKSTMIMTYRGPTLGWVPSYIYPQREVSLDYTITPFDSVIFLTISHPITISLPNISSWVLEPNYNPYNPFERAIWIKDLGGNVDLNNVTVDPFGTQLIDGQLSLVMVQRRMLLRLYPLADLTGWYSG